MAAGERARRGWIRGVFCRTWRCREGGSQGSRCLQPGRLTQEEMDKKTYGGKSGVLRSVKCDAEGDVGVGGVVWEAEERVDGTGCFVNGSSLERSWGWRSLAKPQALQQMEWRAGGAAEAAAKSQV